jgi:hypothetical protein
MITASVRAYNVYNLFQYGFEGKYFEDMRIDDPALVEAIRVKTMDLCKVNIYNFIVAKYPQTPPAMKFAQIIAELKPIGQGKTLSDFVKSGGYFEIKCLLDGERLPLRMDNSPDASKELVQLDKKFKAVSEALRKTRNDLAKSNANLQKSNNDLKRTQELLNLAQTELNNKRHHEQCDGIKESELVSAFQNLLISLKIPLNQIESILHDYGSILEKRMK